jgi:tubulin-specific chaperone A
MPPRSQLEINTSSVLRLVKEEASYHREAVEQVERIKKLENDKSEDENREYLLQQEVCLISSGS